MACVQLNVALTPLFLFLFRSCSVYHVDHARKPLKKVILFYYYSIQNKQSNEISIVSWCVRNRRKDTRASQIAFGQPEEKKPFIRVLGFTIFHSSVGADCASLVSNDSVLVAHVAPQNLLLSFFFSLSFFRLFEPLWLHLFLAARSGAGTILPSTGSKVRSFYIQASCVLSYTFFLLLALLLTFFPHFLYSLNGLRQRPSLLQGG